jgi:hypothetical protein
MTKQKPLSLVQLGLATISLAVTTGFLYSHLRAQDRASRDYVDENPANAQRPLIDSNAEMLRPPVEAPPVTELKLTPMRTKDLRMGGVPKGAFHIPVLAGSGPAEQQQNAKNPLIQPNAQNLGSVEASAVDKP